MTWGDIKLLIEDGIAIYSILFYFDAAVVKISAGVTVAVSSLTAQTAALTSAWISACA